jgi:hypothetical protein
MICQKLNYSPIKSYSQSTDWDFVDQIEPDIMGAVSCDNASDSAIIGLLNWQAEGMMQRLQCCVVRRGDGFGRDVKYYMENLYRRKRSELARWYKSSEWPRYYEFFEGVTIRIGKSQGYYVFSTLKAHWDIIAFSMFTFRPHELRAKSGVAQWVLNNLKLQDMGIDDAICSVNNLLRVMGNLAFGYPIQLGYLGTDDSDARSYGAMLILAYGR